MLQLKNVVVVIKECSNSQKSCGFKQIIYKNKDNMYLNNHIPCYKRCLT